MERGISRISAGPGGISTARGTLLGFPARTFSRRRVDFQCFRQPPGPPVSPDVVQRRHHLPDLGEGPHQVPDPAALEAVLRDEPQLGVHASRVLKPNLVDRAAIVGIVEKGGLGGLVELDGDLVLQGQLNGPLV